MIQKVLRADLDTLSTHYITGRRLTSRIRKESTPTRTLSARTTLACTFVLVGALTHQLAIIVFDASVCLAKFVRSNESI